MSERITGAPMPDALMKANFAYMSSETSEDRKRRELRERDLVVANVAIQFWRENIFSPAVKA